LKVELKSDLVLITKLTPYAEALESGLKVIVLFAIS
jgi:hypothetical protein